MGLTFLSWVRTGLGAELNKINASDNTLDKNEFPLNTSLPINIELNTGKTKTITAYVHGPGDVTGFDTNQIIRKEPCENANQVFPNYIPAIEFDSPELPWMLTTTGPQKENPDSKLNKRGLYPWLCLITIEEPERFVVSPPNRSKPLSSVILPVNELPFLEWSWLWAHTQIVLENQNENIEDIIKNKPDRNLSRLISPMRLKPDKLYQAFVVPVFEAGRLAGLGKDYSEYKGETTGFAWDNSKLEVELPIYTSWRFSTGKHGDFQYLAQLLKPNKEKDTGICKLSILEEAIKLKATVDEDSLDERWTINLEGAVIGSNLVAGKWNMNMSVKDKSSFIEKLSKRLEEKPGVLPLPIYGASYAKDYYANIRSAIINANSQNAFSTLPKYLIELNLDPRYRIAASLGSQIVKNNQEEFMASAWEQAAESNNVNQTLRQGQLALNASQNIYEKRIGESSSNAPLSDSSLVSITASAHTEIFHQNKEDITIANQLKELYSNKSLEGVMSFQYRKLIRPNGRISKRITKVKKPFNNSAEKLAKGELASIYKKIPIAGSIQIENLSNNTISMMSPLHKKPKLTNRGVDKLENGFMSDIIIGFSSGSLIKGTCLATNAKPQLGFSQCSNINSSITNYLTGSNWTYVFSDAYMQFTTTTMGSRAVAYKKVNGEYTVLSANFEMKEDSVGSNITYNMRCFYSLNKGYLFETQPITNYNTPQNSNNIFNVDKINMLYNLEVHYSGNRPTLNISRPCVSFMYIRYKGRNYDINNIVFLTESLNHKKIALTIGCNVDNTGKVLGEWKHIPLDFDCEKTMSMAIHDCRIFILSGRKLLIITLDEDCNIIKTQQSSQWIIPDGYNSGVITACDFGMSSNRDLLFVYAIKDNNSYKYFYKVAYDVDDNGNVLSWSEAVSVPVEDGKNLGVPISVTLGLTDKNGSDRFKEFTDKFKESTTQTQLRLNNILKNNKKASNNSIDIKYIANTIRKEIDPKNAIAQKVSQILDLPDTISNNVTKRLQPITVSPKFTLPVKNLLIDMNAESFLIGVKSIPDNSVTVLKPNNKFIEALLIGMNHEMSNEFLWRNYPADLSATYFNKFWDNSSIKGMELSDISPISNWNVSKGLGENLINNNIGLFLTIRGELLRRLPNVMLYALPAKRDGRKRTIDTTAPKEFPIYSFKIEPDIYFFAFTMTSGEVYGNEQNEGWYFIFNEHPTAPRFGVNESKEGTETKDVVDLTQWNNLEWSMIDTKNNYINFGEDSKLNGKDLPDSTGSVKHKWAFSSAHLAHILLQRPVQVAIHASSLIDQAL